MVPVSPARYSILEYFRIVLRGAQTLKQLLVDRIPVMYQGLQVFVDIK